MTHVQVGCGTASVDHIWRRPLVCFYVKDVSKVKQIVSVLGQEPKWIATLSNTNYTLPTINAVRFCSQIILLLFTR